jgi:hypothetical protein
MSSDNTGILVISNEGEDYNCLVITDSGYRRQIDKFDIQDDYMDLHL